MNKKAFLKNLGIHVIQPYVWSLRKQKYIRAGLYNLLHAYIFNTVSLFHLHTQRFTQLLLFLCKLYVMKLEQSQYMSDMSSKINLNSTSFASYCLVQKTSKSVRSTQST